MCHNPSINKYDSLTLFLVRTTVCYFKIEICTITYFNTSGESRVKLVSWQGSFIL